MGIPLAASRYSRWAFERAPTLKACALSGVRRAAGVAADESSGQMSGKKRWSETAVKR